MWNYPWKVLVKFDPSAFIADPELVATLEKHAEPIHCSEDKLLFRQGEQPSGLYVVRQGRTTISMSSPTGEQVLWSEQTTQGALLGVPALISNHVYTLTAVAHQEADLLFVSREKFDVLMQTDPMISFKVLQLLAAEVRSARLALSKS